MSAAPALRDQWLTIETRHLTALATVADVRSFAGAAADLGYVPSAISSQISFLEGIVGCRLFERHGQGRASTLTAAGAALLEHADEILALLERARADLDGVAAGAPAALVIGRTPLLARRLDDGFAATGGADVQIELTASDSTARLLEQVARGSLDAAFVELPIARGPFSSAELCREPRFIALPADTAGVDVRDALDLVGLVRIRDCLGTRAIVPTLRPATGRACRRDAGGRARVRPRGHRGRRRHSRRSRRRGRSRPARAAHRAAGSRDRPGLVPRTRRGSRVALRRATRTARARDARVRLGSRRQPAGDTVVLRVRGRALRLDRRVPHAQPSAAGAAVQLPELRSARLELERLEVVRARGLIVEHSARMSTRPPARNASHCTD